MAIATRWIGAGSVAVVVVGLGALLVGKGAARRTPAPPSAAKPDPAFELRRCESGISSFATNSRDAADFDRCLVDHARDVLSLRHEGAREVITTSMYSDL